MADPIIALRDYLGNIGSMWDTDPDGQHRLIFNRTEIGGGESLTLVGLEDYIRGIVKEMLPPPPVAPKNIIVDGHFFGLSNGERWTAIECSDFALLAKYTNGEDIRPVLQQRSDCGFNLLRVWTAFDIPGIGTFTTIDYAKIPPFVQLCYSYGLYVEFTGYTGINDPYHWAKLVEAAHACAASPYSTVYPIMELVNELDQNTNEPDAWGRVFNPGWYPTPPPGLITSHGSNGSQAAPVRPAWSYETFHTNMANEWWRKTGHNAMEFTEGAEGLAASGVPTLTNENTRYLDGENSRMHSYDAAAGAALLCAGSCFHSVNGKASVLWSEEEANCASLWAAGARSVDLTYQVGSYRHAAELETAIDLRVYQRVLPDGRAFTVEIRK